MTDSQLTTRSGSLAHPGAPALLAAITAWASATTDQTSDRLDDLLRDKIRAVSEFFEYVRKPPQSITDIDVLTWRSELAQRNFAPATVYAMISRISSFYDWAMQDPSLSKMINRNPVTLARPRAPKPYQSESVQALDDGEVLALQRLVKQRANSGSLVAKRDYAMLLMYLLTGMRRAEVARLRWCDIKPGSPLIVRARLKGGEYINFEIQERAVQKALFHYLEASGRLSEMQPDSPLWTRHDRAGKPGARLSSHAFVNNLKSYALEAGIGDIHLHQTRHTFARIIAEDSGSLNEAQEALNHKHQATTRVYVRRVGLKKDKTSRKVARRLDLE